MRTMPQPVPEVSSPATRRNEILIRAAILLVGGIVSLLMIVAQTSAEHSRSAHHISGDHRVQRADLPVRR
jgi:hypothetical protein